MNIEHVSIALQKHMDITGLFRKGYMLYYSERTAFYLVNGGVFHLTSAIGGLAREFRLNITECFRSRKDLQYHNAGLPSTGCDVLLVVEIKDHNGDWLSYCTCTIPELFKEINCSTLPYPNTRMEDNIL